MERPRWGSGSSPPSQESSRASDRMLVFFVGHRIGPASKTGRGFHRGAKTRANALRRRK